MTKYMHPLFILSILAAGFYAYTFYDMQQNIKTTVATYTCKLNSYTGLKPDLDYEFRLNEVTYIGKCKHIGITEITRSAEINYIRRHMKGQHVVVYYDQRNPHHNALYKYQLQTESIICMIIFTIFIGLRFLVDE